MKNSALDMAKRLLRRRKFAQVVDILADPSRENTYEDSFDYYLTLGLANLYLGDIGSATKDFNKARGIRTTNTTLLLAQAVIYLRRGSVDKALPYYLDVLTYEPQNRVAKKALDFIKNYGTNTDVIARFVDSGRIERFYPPLGFNPSILRNFMLIIFAGVLCGSLYYFFGMREVRNWIGPRANLESFVLSDEEKASAHTNDSSALFEMSEKEILSSYDKAVEYFQSHRDNAAQVEINRILFSNASLAIKKNASTLMSYLEQPTFDTIKDNYTFETVEKNLRLYLDCYVVWSGRVSNEETFRDGSWRCELLVGYEDMRRVDGIVPVRFKNAPSVDRSRPIRILGKVSEQDGALFIEGVAVYQPLKSE